MPREDVLELRARKDEFFRSHPNSPIPPDRRAAFAGLAYFEHDPALEILAPLEPDPSREEVVMETSTGAQRLFVRAGWVSFTVGGEPARLALYADAAVPDPREFFVPFRDATSGAETYGAGRYVEASLTDDGEVHLDLNAAYHPFCAYADGWSCPVPPAENRLSVPVRAGEREPSGRDVPDAAR
jgi:uncharacterized protein (DUF1684 family)